MRFSIRRSRVAVVAVSMALVAGAAAASAAPRPAAPPSLTGTVTLSGSTTGYIKVVVPRTARLGDPLFDQRKNAVHVVGGGSVAGFALVREGLPDDGPAVVGGRFGFLNRQGAREGQPLLINLAGSAAGEGFDYLVPRGAYRLYLITDGKPAKVTLRFAGLTGSRALSPSVRAPLTVQDGAGGLDVQAQGQRTAYSAGDDFSFDRPTLNFSTFAMKHDVHTESVYTSCLHTAKPVGPNPYLPGCPTAGGGTTLIFPQIVSDEYIRENQLRAFWGGFVAKRGHYGVGGNLLTITPAEDVAYSHFWLGL